MAPTGDPADESGDDRALVVRLLGAPLSGEVVTAALALSDRVATLPADVQVLLAQLWARLTAAGQARQWEAEALVTTIRDDERCEWMLESDQVLSREGELEAALRVTSAQLEADLLVARGLRHCPVMTALLREGSVSPRHARVLAQAIRLLDAADQALVDAAVSYRGVTVTSPAFKRIVDAVVAKLDAERPHRRVKRVRDAYGITYGFGSDGIADLGMSLSNVDAAALINAINDAANAHRGPDDERTLGQRQVDAVLDAFGVLRLQPDDTAEPAAAQPTSGQPTSGEPPSGQPTSGEPTSAEPASTASSDAKPTRGPAHVTVTVDLFTLLGLQQGGGMVDGLGTISASEIRALITRDGATLQRLVHDSVTGEVIDYATTRYPADARLRRYLAARDATCRFPGCTRQARWCDVEHITPHDEGGPSSMANTALLCRRHHRMKTVAGHRYRHTEDRSGRTEWTTSLGFGYERGPTTVSADGIDPGDTERVRLPDGIPDRPGEAKGRPPASPPAGSPTAGPPPSAVVDEPAPF